MQFETETEVRDAEFQVLEVHINCELLFCLFVWGLLVVVYVWVCFFFWWFRFLVFCIKELQKTCTTTFRKCTTKSPKVQWEDNVKRHSLNPYV